MTAKPTLAARGSCLYPIVDGQLTQAPLSIEQTVAQLVEAHAEGSAFKVRVATEGRGRRELTADESAELVAATTAAITDQDNNERNH